MRLQCNESQGEVPASAVRAGFAPDLDALGIVASSVCLVHCLALPLVLLCIPTFASGLLRDDRTHYVLAFFVTAFCLSAVVPGFLCHKKLPVLLVMSAGLSLVLFATFASGSIVGQSFEIPLITVGNLMVVTAHMLNRKLLSCSHG